jgi:hypothetical protein
MQHSAEEYETRAAECERLAYATDDLILREEILSLGRVYRGYADHLRGRIDRSIWPIAANA